MASLYILIPIALIFVAIAIKAFMWAVDNHQYDDLDAAARSILFDDDAEVTVAEDLKAGDSKDQEVLKAPSQEQVETSKPAGGQSDE